MNIRDGGGVGTAAENRQRREVGRAWVSSGEEGWVVVVDIGDSGGGGDGEKKTDGEEQVAARAGSEKWPISPFL